MLERLCHSDACFVTLTYAPENVTPVEGNRAVGNLVPKELQDWLKRFREAVQPKDPALPRVLIRYYAVGEYSDDKPVQGLGMVYGRPHYHVAIFGYPGCHFGQSRSVDPGKCCSMCDFYARTWGLGLIHLGSLSLDSASYICGYVTKKMVKGDRRLEGRHPEFSRQSLRPGIGADAMWDYASSLMEFGLDMKPDVPVGARHGKSILPLGRYLRGKLRQMIGHDPKMSPVAMEALRDEMSLLRDVAFERNESFASAVVREGEAGFLRLQARLQIYAKAKRLK